MARPHRDPVVGSVIDDRFHIKRPLAEGGMARVYIARDGAEGPRVAVKIFNGSVDGPDYKQLLARAKREADTMDQLDHPHIVKTLAHGSWGTGYYMAMELIDGRSLTNYVRDTQADPSTCIGLLLQLSSAVRYAHRKGIVHRDLKAANVLVTLEDGAPLVKLLDFGVVKVDGLATLSGTNTLLGSVHTMPPEHVRGETVDHRADIYSLGVLGFRLLQGRYPYHSRVAAEIITQHVHAPIPEMDASPDIPAGVPPIIRKCLAKNPADRYDDVGELVAELSEALEVPTSMFANAGSTGGNRIKRLHDPQSSSTEEPPTVSNSVAETQASQKIVAGIVAGLLLLALVLIYFLA